MKNKILLLLIIWSISLNISNAQKIPLDSLDIYLEQVIKDFEVVGLSVGIVKNDTVIYSKGFGSREIGKDPKVNDQTTFGIGSISKSFTALTLGLLVDEGKISWDDRCSHTEVD
jgi:CubicO group peptidase (beta-lactamase class C family)